MQNTIFLKNISQVMIQKVPISATTLRNKAKWTVYTNPIHVLWHNHIHPMVVEVQISKNKPNRSQIML